MGVARAKEFCCMSDYWPDHSRPVHFKPFHLLGSRYKKKKKKTRKKSKWFFLDKSTCNVSGSARRTDAPQTVSSLCCSERVSSTHRQAEQRMLVGGCVLTPYITDTLCDIRRTRHTSAQINNLRFLFLSRPCNPNDLNAFF